MDRTACALIFLAALSGISAYAQEAGPPVGGSWETAARNLQAATVTVRIWGQSQAPAAEAPRDAKAKGERQLDSVTVCSGVCVREGRVITAAFAGSDTRIRLTLAGGKQAEANVQVIDEYSGLALLRTDAQALVPLAIAEKQPAVGGELLAAAAWGLEQPIVSRGMVGGIGRKYPGASYPPLLQCDILTLATSSGGGLVDREGRLVGVIVAADRESSRRGWAYAVPAAHVQRILRASDEQQAGGITILKRRRPLVGMVLDQEDEAVVVQRVTAEGPAEKAGIKPGDRVLATDGVAIRSVYQAVLPTLFKQPGDTTTFRVQRADGVHDVEVVLGGGVELAPAPFDLLAELVQPKVRLVRDSDGAIASSRRESNVREVFAPPLPDDEPPAALAPTAADKIALFEKALSRYQAVIELQQKQLGEEQKRRQEQDELIRSLRDEMETLRRAIAAEKGK